MQNCFERIYNILLEKYENPFNLLQNPEFNDKSLSDLLGDFKKDGGRVLGSGHYGLVLSHPAWSYVLKIFSKDSCYVTFTRTVLQNPHPCFPIFYGPARKIIPNFRRKSDQEFFYMIRMEKLEPITIPKHDKFRYLLKEELFFGMDKDTLIDLLDKYMMDDEFNDKVKRFKEAMDICYNMYKKYPDRCGFDLHDENVMFRPSDGNYVITDPFYETHTSERSKNIDVKIGRVIGNLVKQGVSDFETIDNINHIPGGKRRPKKLKKLLRKYGEKAIHYGEKEEQDNDMKI